MSIGPDAIKTTAFHHSDTISQFSKYALKISWSFDLQADLPPDHLLCLVCTRSPRAAAVAPAAGPAEMSAPLVFGGLFGFGVVAFKNALQQLPFYRKPWEHVVSITICAYTAQWIANQENVLVEEIAKKYEEMGQERRS